jgi:hypothetical protein
MIVHLNIATAADLKVTARVRSEKRQHMVEKSAARVDLALARAVKTQRKLYIRFRSFAVYIGNSHFISPLQCLQAR